MLERCTLHKDYDANEAVNELLVDCVIYCDFFLFYYYFLLLLQPIFGNDRRIETTPHNPVIHCKGYNITAKNR